MDSTSHFQRGKQLIELGRLDAARTEFFTVLAGDPRHTTAHCYLAYIFYLQQEFDSAMKHLQVVFAEDPHNAWAYRIASSVMRRRNRLKEAENFARTALSYEPDGVYEHINMSIVHLVYTDDRTATLFRKQALERLTRAREHAEKALSLDPEEPDAYHQAALVHLRLSGWEPKRSAEHLSLSQAFLDAGLRIQADHTNLLVLKSQVHEMQNQSRESTQVALGALRNDPTNSRAQHQVQALIESMVQRQGWVGMLLAGVLTGYATREIYGDWIEALPLCTLSLGMGYSARILLAQHEIHLGIKNNRLPAALRIAFDQWKKSHRNIFPLFLGLYVILWLVVDFSADHSFLHNLQRVLYQLSRIVLAGGLMIVLLMRYMNALRNNVLGGQNGFVGCLQAIWLLRSVVFYGFVGLFLISLLPEA
ncbi:hypothetical protein [Deinococcus cellulosilyticus]|uniref:Uncharacterized protein n=1 Tax=Deinococcus cellulosilyticus (strain DSM 18568 / NBRC 106333 / KACC 11606 / 5516J-15) TaxID=1223518 RepID=A0A511MWB9_DEIC1|nr:hypothetical protein [Deinococcus cellulosilyticus]GEM44850.1 hypothetical protein DC3_04850 [Deinococcus cellulosilyticus NBRC 106333 = KACC 11606]